MAMKSVWMKGVSMKSVSMKGFVMKWQRSVVGMLIVVAGLCVLGAGGAAASDDEAWIKYRQKVMSSIGSDMGGIADILKNGLPLIPNIEHHARSIAANALAIEPAFEHRVVAGATDAKPEIWQKREEWRADIEKLRRAADQLAAAAAGNDAAQIGPSVKALGKTCGGCHESFRKPKEESYKNR